MIAPLRKSTIKNFWLRVTGEPSDFSMENMAFNFVCVISVMLLLYGLIANIFFGLYVISVVLAFLIVLLLILFYFSRVKKNYGVPIVIYAICGHGLLIFNYFFNDGISGPTIAIMNLVFVLIIAIGKPRQYLFWIALQMIVPFTLLFLEYSHPDWIPESYKSRADRFVDVGLTYAVGIIFIYAVINFLRQHYLMERNLAEGRLEAIIAQNKLITEQYRQLEKVNEEKNKLFSIVSHDLKGPIDSVMSYLEILAETQLEAGEKSEIEADLLERTKYASDMIHNLLSWAKAQMQGVTVHLTTIQLNQMLDSITRSKLTSAVKKRIKLTWSIPPSIQVIGDPDMLMIIIRNLVNNAIKFTRPGGEIIIKAVKKDKDVVIAVKDNGIGIAPDKQAEIFSLKTQSTYGTNNEKGIGLGLKMCKEFIDYQNGKIWFESEVGTGTTFLISLPQPLV